MHLVSKAITDDNVNIKSHTIQSQNMSNSVLYNINTTHHSTNNQNSLNFSITNNINQNQNTIPFRSKCENYYRNYYKNNSFKDGYLITSLPSSSMQLNRLPTGSKVLQTDGSINESQEDHPYVPHSLNYNNNERYKNNKNQENSFIPFPIISNFSFTDNPNSLSFLINHPQKYIDKSKKINFNENPSVKRGPVFNCRSKESKNFYSLGIKYPHCLHNFNEMFSKDFNKMNMKVKNSYEWNKSHSPEEARKEEIEKRNIFKYKDNRPKRKRNLCLLNSYNEQSNEIQKAKEILREKYPLIKGLGYQNMNIPPIYKEKNNNQVCIININ